MQRYFAKIDQGFVILKDDDFFHLYQVMRAKIDDEIEVVFNGELYLAKVSSLKPQKISVIKKINQQTELEHHVTLMFAPLKGQKTELVIQKATELGVSEIILVLTKRTIARYQEKDVTSKLIRYQKIIKEASEQSKRVIIPNIKYYSDFNEALKIEGDLKLIANENVSGPTNSFNQFFIDLKKHQKIIVLIGPEGGFEAEEIALALKHNFFSVSLGQRILRAETAAFYALSVIVNNLEYK